MLYMEVSHVSRPKNSCFTLRTLLSSSVHFRLDNLIAEGRALEGLLRPPRNATQYVWLTGLGSL